jgi:hypothetical protein
MPIARRRGKGPSDVSTDDPAVFSLLHFSDTHNNSRATDALVEVAITSGLVRTLKGSPWAGRDEMFEFQNYQNEGTAHVDCKRNQRWREVRGVHGSYQD